MTTIISGNISRKSRKKGKPMAIIQQDILNPNKMEQVTPDQALDEAMHIASIGYETQKERMSYEHKELVQIVGRLLNTLSEKKLLDDQEIVKVLECSTIKYGSYVGDSPQGL
jgi:predicted chitinase